MLVVLVLPTLEAVVGADVVDDGPMTICGTVVVGTTDVDGAFEPGSVAVFGVPVPALVLIVTDGIPGTDEHTASNANNENA